MNKTIKNIITIILILLIVPLKGKQVMSSLNNRTLIETNSVGSKLSSIEEAIGNRSIATSTLTAIICTFIKLTITGPMGVSPLNDYIFVQMIFGNLIGFIFDQGIATKEGYSLRPWKKVDGLTTLDENNKITWNGDKFNYNEQLSKLESTGGNTNESNLTWVKYILQKTGSNQFIKYCVTVLIDIIISTILYSIASNHFIAKQKAKQAQQDSEDNSEEESEPVLDKNTDLFLQGGIGIITFYVYVNITRLSWAYVDDPDKGVSVGIIALGIASSMAYLVMAEGKELFESIKGKIMLVGSLFMLLLISSSIENNEKLTNGIPALGAVFIILITLLCIRGAKSDTKAEIEDETDSINDGDNRSDGGDSDGGKSSKDGDDSDGDDSDGDDSDDSDDSASGSGKTKHKSNKTLISFNTNKCNTKAKSKSSYINNIKNIKTNNSKNESNDKINNDSNSESDNESRDSSEYDSDNSNISDISDDSLTVVTKKKCTSKQKSFLSKIF